MKFEGFDYEFEITALDKYTEDYGFCPTCSYEEEVVEFSFISFNGKENFISTYKAECDYSDISVQSITEFVINLITDKVPFDDLKTKFDDFFNNEDSYYRYVE